MITADTIRELNRRGLDSIAIARATSIDLTKIQFILANKSANLEDSLLDFHDWAYKVSKKSKNHLSRLSCIFGKA
jgi:hypothetical protein